MNGVLYDFVISNDINADGIKNQTLEPQTSGFVKILGDPQSVKTVQVKIKSLKELLPTKLEKRLRMLLQPSKIESMTRF